MHAKRPVPAVSFLRPIKNHARDASIGEPLQKKLRPLLECLPDIGHALAPDNLSPFCVSGGAVSSARAPNASRGSIRCAVLRAHELPAQEADGASIGGHGF